MLVVRPDPVDANLAKRKRELRLQREDKETKQVKKRRKLTEKDQSDVKKEIERYALFSYGAYTQKPGIRQKLMDDFDVPYKYDDESSTMNFAIYRHTGNKTGDDPDVVMAFRGTSQWQDVIADGYIAVNKVEKSPRFKRMLMAFEDELAKIKQKQQTIVVTGHSLGGSIANAIGAEHKVNAIVFNRGSGVSDLIGDTKSHNTIQYTTNGSGEIDPISWLSSIGAAPGEQIVTVGEKDLGNVLPDVSLDAHSLRNFQPKGPTDSYWDDLQKEEDDYDTSSSHLVYEWLMDTIGYKVQEKYRELGSSAFKWEVLDKAVTGVSVSTFIGYLMKTGRISQMTATQIHTAISAAERTAEYTGRGIMHLIRTLSGGPRSLMSTISQWQTATAAGRQAIIENLTSRMQGLRSMFRQSTNVADFEMSELMNTEYKDIDELMSQIRLNNPQAAEEYIEDALFTPEEHQALIQRWTEELEAMETRNEVAGVNVKEFTPEQQAELDTIVTDANKIEADELAARLNAFEQETSVEEFDRFLADAGDLGQLTDDELLAAIEEFEGDSYVNIANVLNKSDVPADYVELKGRFDVLEERYPDVNLNLPGRPDPGMDYKHGDGTTGGEELPDTTVEGDPDLIDIPGEGATDLVDVPLIEGSGAAPEVIGTETADALTVGGALAGVGGVLNAAAAGAAFGTALSAILAPSVQKEQNREAIEYKLRRRNMLVEDLANKQGFDIKGYVEKFIHAHPDTEIFFARDSSITNSNTDEKYRIHNSDKRELNYDMFFGERTLEYLQQRQKFVDKRGVFGNLSQELQSIANAHIPPPSTPGDPVYTRNLYLARQDYENANYQKGEYGYHGETKDFDPGGYIASPEELKRIEHEYNSKKQAEEKRWRDRHALRWKRKSVYTNTIQETVKKYWGLKEKKTWQWSDKEKTYVHTNAKGEVMSYHVKLTPVELEVLSNYRRKNNTYKGDKSDSQEVTSDELAYLKQVHERINKFVELGKKQQQKGEHGAIDSPPSSRSGEKDTHGGGQPEIDINHKGKPYNGNEHDGPLNQRRRPHTDNSQSHKNDRNDSKDDDTARRHQTSNQGKGKGIPQGNPMLDTPHHMYSKFVKGNYVTYTWNKKAGQYDISSSYSRDPKTQKWVLSNTLNLHDPEHPMGTVNADHMHNAPGHPTKTPAHQVAPGDQHDPFQSRHTSESTFSSSNTHGISLRQIHQGNYLQNKLNQMAMTAASDVNFMRVLNEREGNW